MALLWAGQLRWNEHLDFAETDVVVTTVAGQPTICAEQQAVIVTGGWCGTAGDELRCGLCPTSRPSAASRSRSAWRGFSFEVRAQIRRGASLMDRALQLRRRRERWAWRGKPRCRFVAGPVCPRCDCLHCYIQELDLLGQPIGVSKPAGPHCTTCCSPHHWACVGCGKCLPTHRGSLGDRAKLNRRTCSSAYRQRAYRRRKRAARASVSHDEAGGTA